MLDPTNNTNNERTSKRTSLRARTHTRTHARTTSFASRSSVSFLVLRCQRCVSHHLPRLTMRGGSDVGSATTALRGGALLCSR